MDEAEKRGILIEAKEWLPKFDWVVRIGRGKYPGKGGFSSSLLAAKSHLLEKRGALG